MNNVNNNYSVRNTKGQYTRVVNGRLYNVDGAIARFEGKTSTGKYKFRIHDTWHTETIPSKIRLATKDEVKKYLDNSRVVATA